MGRNKAKNGRDIFFDNPPEIHDDAVVENIDIAGSTPREFTRLLERARKMEEYKSKRSNHKKANRSEKVNRLEKAVPRAHHVDASAKLPTEKPAKANKRKKHSTKVSKPKLDDEDPWSRVKPKRPTAAFNDYVNEPPKFVTKHQNKRK